MKKRGKNKRFRFKSTAFHQVSQPRRIELEPGEGAIYVHRAEQYVIPIIREYQLPPAVALFLLAQYTQALATGDSRITVESATAIAPNVLALWEAGYYSPGPDYPYTLEETLQDVHRDQEVKRDYAEFFQPFVPLEGDKPRGIGSVPGGLVRHPETHLWQIWMLVDGPCVQLAAYRDPLKAQRLLGEIVKLSRERGKMTNVEVLRKRLSSQGDEVPKQIPFDMMEYLIDHIDLYTIHL